MTIQFLILKWLSYWWFPSVEQSGQALVELFNKVLLWEQTKGKLWVIKHLKEMKLLYTRHLCGDPITVSKHLIGIRKDGLPKGFPILNSIFLHGSNDDVRFVLTCLSLSRTIKAWNELDLSTITNDRKGTDIPERSLNKFIKLFMKDFMIRPITINWSPKDFHYSIKSGPNGLASWTSVIDAMLLPDSLRENLEFLSFNLWFEMINWTRFSPGKIWEVLNKRTKRDKLINHTRKLSVVQDPDGKTRVIAILDYWSQSWLRLVHNKVFDILKNIPQDRTFTQDPKVEFQGPYYSFDLSAATDRFPLSFQQRVMRYLFASNAKAIAWAELLVKEPFLTPDGSTTITYKVGQPMGAYSSWAVFALSHHILVQYSAYLIGQYPTKNYILLGDDIVIGGDALANSYKRQIETLGVEISTHKTHVSTNTYEFAKRWFRNGVEVSGLQLNAFQQELDNYPGLFRTIKTYYERGLFPKRICSYSSLVSTLLVEVGYPLKHAKNLARKVDVLNAFYRWIHQGDIEQIKQVLYRLVPEGATIPWYNEEIAKDFILMIFDMVYQVLHQRLVNKVNTTLDKIPNILNEDTELSHLPELSEDEVIDLDNLLAEEDEPLQDYLTPSDINHLPVSRALANIQEKLMNDPRINSDDLSLALEALVLPEVDNIGFKNRNVDIIVKHNVFAQKIPEYYRIASRAPMFQGQWKYKSKLTYI